MASPITSADFGNFSEAGDLCERINRMMGALDKLKPFLDYLVDSDGEFTQAVRSIGLLPPGVVVYYSTTTSSFDAAKAEVEKIGRTADDIASGTGPFWRICDGTNGTPDLRGRFVVGANDTADNGLSIRAVSSTGGVETVTLSLDQIPAHTHTIDAHEGDGVNSGDWVKTTDETTDRADVTSSEVGGGESHDNMPPFYALYPIIRTSRIF